MKPKQSEQSAYALRSEHACDTKLHVTYIDKKASNANSRLGAYYPSCDLAVFYVIEKKVSFYVLESGPSFTCT